MVWAFSILPSVCSFKPESWGKHTYSYWHHIHVDTCEEENPNVPSRAIILLPNSLTYLKATTVDATATTLINDLLCSTIHMCNASIWSCVTVLYSLIPLTEVVQELIHSFSCLLCICREVKSRFNPPVPRNGGIMIGVLYEPEWYVHY